MFDHIFRREKKLETKDLTFQNKIKDRISELKNKLPPVAEPVDPATDLKEVRGENKQSKLIAFKERMFMLQNILTQYRTLIESEIINNPDTPIEDLRFIVQEFCAEYNLTAQHRQQGMEAVNMYYDSRKRAKDLLNKSKNNLDTVEHLTGVRFDPKEKDNFRIELGLMNLNIYTSTKNLTFLFKHLNSSVSGGEVGAFHSYMLTDKSVSFNVFSHEDDPEDLKLAKIHEDEHAKYRILDQIFDRNLVSKKTSLLYREMIFLKNRGDASFKEKMEEYMYSVLDEMFNRAKDEILALKKESSTYKTEDYINLFSQDPAYNYAQQVKSNYEDNSLYQQYVKEILEDRYTQTIIASLESFDRISSDGSLNKNEIIAFLGGVPLENWTKTIDRFLATKNMTKS